MAPCYPHLGREREDFCACCKGSSPISTPVLQRAFLTPSTGAFTLWASLPFLHQNHSGQNNPIAFQADKEDSIPPSVELKSDEQEAEDWKERAGPVYRSYSKLGSLSKHGRKAFKDSEENYIIRLDLRLPSILNGGQNKE